MTFLERAKALIADPKNWCKGAAAKSKNGTQVSALSPLATKFCASGACRRVAYINNQYATPNRKLRLLKKAIKSLNIGYCSLPDVNDNSNHKTIMKIFDLAIAEEKRLKY